MTAAFERAVAVGLRTLARDGYGGSHDLLRSGLAASYRDWQAEAAPSRLTVETHLSVPSSPRLPGRSPDDYAAIAADDDLLVVYRRRGVEVWDGRMGWQVARIAPPGMDGMTRGRRVVLWSQRWVEVVDLDTLRSSWGAGRHGTVAAALSSDGTIYTRAGSGAVDQWDASVRHLRSVAPGEVTPLDADYGAASLWGDQPFEPDIQVLNLGSGRVLIATEGTDAVALDLSTGVRVHLGGTAGRAPTWVRTSVGRVGHLGADRLDVFTLPDGAPAGSVGVGGERPHAVGLDDGRLIVADRGRLVLVGHDGDVLASLATSASSSAALTVAGTSVVVHRSASLAGVADGAGEVSLWATEPSLRNLLQEPATPAETGEAPVILGVADGSVWAATPRSLWWVFRPASDDHVHDAEFAVMTDSTLVISDGETVSWDPAGADQRCRHRHLEDLVVVAPGVIATRALDELRIWEHGRLVHVGWYPMRPWALTTLDNGRVLLGLHEGTVIIARWAPSAGRLLHGDRLSRGADQ